MYAYLLTVLSGSNVKVPFRAAARRSLGIYPNSKTPEAHYVSEYCAILKLISRQNSSHLID